MMIKSMVTQFRQFADASKNDPELANAFAAVNKRLAARQQKLAEDVDLNVIAARTAGFACWEATGATTWAIVLSGSRSRST